MEKNVSFRRETEIGKNRNFHARIATMNEAGLMGEFKAMLVNTVGKELTLTEAGQCQHLMERLQAVSHCEILKAQLQVSLGVLKCEISRLKN